MLWRNISHCCCCSCSLLLHLFFLSSPPIQSLLPTTTNETYTFIKCFFDMSVLCWGLDVYLYIFYRRMKTQSSSIMENEMIVSFFLSLQSETSPSSSPPILVFVFLSLFLSSVWCISSSILWSNIYLLHVGCLVFPLCLWRGGAGCGGTIDACGSFCSVCAFCLNTHQSKSQPTHPLPSVSLCFISSWLLVSSLSLSLFFCFCFSFSVFP